jgi:hypothetical protein
MKGQAERFLRLLFETLEGACACYCCSKIESGTILLLRKKKKEKKERKKTHPLGIFRRPPHPGH